MPEVNPSSISTRYVEESKAAVRALGENIHIVGFIASDDKPSVAYANATRRTFEKAGFNYELRRVQRLALEDEIHRANDDPQVHGIFIYFPIFNNQEDNYLRNLVHYTKDIEAGSSYWTRKMSANDRRAVQGSDDRKALVPCTPLAIVKIIDDIGEYHLAGRKVAIFNRSEVIGRPLAVMLSNDGAEVISFDINGPLEFVDGRPQEIDTDRTAALADADIVVTGVPSAAFPRITAAELKSDVICINFSSIPNYETDVADHVRIFVPRVGPMTVAMCMRNTIRLFENFHR
ncbi:MAG: bifunctional methylenetetrahydrofolate dehydrogenase/methenyltetrahydrofolate cyclohydrolase [Gammaproteobacteria bacterium]